MTTNTLAAIRQRADEREYRIVYNERSDEEQVDPQVYADVAALLAIVDELTARAEAAEAALAEKDDLLYVVTSAHKLLREAIGLTEGQGIQEAAQKEAMRKRLLREQAADALAAHVNGESAGNGGA